MGRVADLTLLVSAGGFMLLLLMAEAPVRLAMLILIVPGPSVALTCRMQAVPT